MGTTGSARGGLPTGRAYLGLYLAQTFNPVAYKVHLIRELIRIVTVTL
jgi:hypothetical protein